MYKSTSLLFLFSIAFCIRMLIAVPFVHDWDGYVFTESAKHMLQGITPYKTVALNDPTIYPDSDRIMTEQWYGYPPLPLLMFTMSYGLAKIIGVPLFPIIENIVIKLPFIFGDLFCAFLVMQLLKPLHPKGAKRAALLILFNPYIIWISAAWGMFDIWMVNFYLLFLLALRKNIYAQAGIALALAVQIKLFVVFFLPLSILYAFQKITSAKQRIIFLTTFLLTTLVIDIPFFLSSPQGFMNQNLLMHMARPPQGIGIVAMVDYLARTYTLHLDMVSIIMTMIGVILVLFFNIFSLGYIQGKEKHLLLAVTFVYSTTLLFNKVVNEQYFVVLVVLLIILVHFPIAKIPIFSKKLFTITEIVTSIVVLFAGVILGFHFLTFLPPFLSDGFLNTSTNYLVFFLSKSFPSLARYAYPDSLWTYYHLPITITYLLLLPLYALITIIIYNGTNEFWKTRNEIKNTLVPLQAFTLQKRYYITFTVFLLLCIVVSKPLVTFLKDQRAFTLVDLVDKNHKAVFPSHPRIGTYYYTWWNNPSHRKNIRDDAWTVTTLTPKTGYYTSKNSYFVQHIQQMKHAGIDFAILSYHLYDRERYITFGQYAQKLGLYYVPLIETHDAFTDDTMHASLPDGKPQFGYRISKATQDILVSTIISTLARDVEHRSLLKIHNKPVVMVYDGHYYFPSWDSESKKALAQILMKSYAKKGSDVYDNISAAWGVPVHSINDLLQYYPTSIKEFNIDNSQIDRDYKTAFVSNFHTYWQAVRHDVEAKVGKVYLMSTYDAPLPDPTIDIVIQPQDIVEGNIFDSEFFYSMSNTWTFWRNTTTPEQITKIWEKQIQDQSQRDKSRGLPSFVSVIPHYNDTLVRGSSLGFVIPQMINGQNTYDTTWQIALDNKADFITIATWNEFFEGTAIEPTNEYGNQFLDSTQKWVKTFNKEKDSIK